MSPEQPTSDPPSPTDEPPEGVGSDAPAQDPQAGRETSPRRRALLWTGLSLPWLALVVAVLFRGPLHDASQVAEKTTGGAVPSATAPVVGLAQIQLQVVNQEGDPVGGAEVSFEAPSGARAHGLTDPEGQLSLVSLPEELGLLMVSAEGHAREALSAHARIRAAVLRVTLGPGASLSGQVVDVSGEPVKNARVRLRPLLDDAVAPWEAQSDEGGVFEVHGLRPGRHRIEVDAEGYGTTGRRGRTGEEVRIVLHRTGHIGGRVSEASGRPAVGATVVLAGSGVWPARQLSTDEQGRFAFHGVIAGIYEVRAFRGEEVAQPREGLSLDAGQEVDLSLRLTPGRSLLGVVVAAADEAPIEGAEIMIGEHSLSMSPRVVRTSGQGTFRIGGLRALPHQVSVHATGFVSVVSETHHPRAEPIRFQLRRASTLEGVVVDARGAPVGGVHVDVVGTTDSGSAMTLVGSGGPFRAALVAAQLTGPLPVDPSGELGVTLGTVPPIPMELSTASAGGTAQGVVRHVTDEQGRFLLSGVPPGALQLVARQSDQAPGFSEPLLVVAGSAHRDLRIELPEGGRVSGRVVDARGFPVGHVRVELHAEQEPFPRMVLTPDDGTFELRGVVGTATVTAYPPARPPARKTITVEPGGDVELVLALEGELHTLRARTVDDRGFPVADARIRVRALRGRSPARRTALSSEDGTVELPGLPPPPWRLEAQHEEYAQARVGRVATSASEVTIVLPPGTSVLGRVLDDWRDGPVSGAEVTLRPRGDTARTGEDGRFEIQLIPAGNYTLYATGTDLVPIELPLSLATSPLGLEPMDVGDLRLAPAGSVTGVVTDALGAAVSGAEVGYGDPPRYTNAARTDAQGRFRIAGLSPGETSVTARHPAAGQVHRDSVRVRAQEETADLQLRLPRRLDAESADLGGGHRTGVAVTVSRRVSEVRLGRPLSGTRAAVAGLRRGDVLLSVDDEPVTSVAHARGLLRGPAGVEVILELRRGRRTVRVPVAREAYEAP